MAVTILIIAAVSFFVVVLLLKPFSRTDEMTTSRMEEMMQEGQPEKPAFGLADRKNKKKAKSGDSKKRFAEWLDRKSGEAAVKRMRDDGDEPEVKVLTRQDSDIKKLMAVANYHISIRTFNLLRIIAGLFFAGVGFFCLKMLETDGGMTLFGTAVAGLVGTLFPKSMLKSAAKKRRSEIFYSLADSIDLIAMSVEAGMPYSAAIQSIAKFDQRAAIQELSRTVDDINKRVPVKKAYEALAARCDIEEIRMFASNMAQAEENGVAPSSVLKAQAKTMRKARSNKMEAAINRAPVAMVVPMVLFIFPAIFIVLLGPAVMNIMTIL